MHLGYIKDSTSHAVLSALGIYDAADTSRETTRAVVWAPGAEQAELVEYEGQSTQLCHANGFLL